MNKTLPKELSSPLHPDYPCLIRFKGHIYKCATSAYLAQSLKPSKQHLFETCSGKEAKLLIKRLNIPFENESILFDIQKAKFEQHPRLQELLIRYSSNATDINTKTLTKLKQLYIADKKRLQLDLKNIAVIGEEYDDSKTLNDWIDLCIALYQPFESFIKLGAEKFLHTVHVGVEQIAFWSSVQASLNKNIKQLLYLPYPCDFIKSKNSEIFGIDDWVKIMKQANGVRYAEPHPTPESQSKIDEIMVKDCDALFLLQQHNNPSLRVNNALAIAEQLDKPIICFDTELMTYWCPSQKTFRDFRKIMSILKIYNND